MVPQDLYGLPRERFTEERNRLARQLRSEGARDQAAEVAKLRKPSVSAWAVNQLVRTQRRDVEALFKAGDALREAHAGLLRKRSDPHSLRLAADAERQAMDQLTAKAQGLVNSAGHELTAAQLEYVAQTFHAAALDEDARTQVRDGCLTRELRHIGLGPGSAGIATQPVNESPAGARRERTTERQAELKAARELEAEARRRAERAARQASTAQQRRNRASEALRDAEEALASARASATQAERDLRAAERAVRKLSS